MSRVRLLLAAFVAAMMTVVALVMPSILTARAAIEDVTSRTIFVGLTRFRLVVALVMRHRRILAVVLCGALGGVVLLWPTPSTAAVHMRHRSRFAVSRITRRARRRTGDCNDNGEILAPCASSKSVKIGDNVSVGYTFTNNNLESVFITPTTSGTFGGCSVSPTSVTVPSHQARSFTVTCSVTSDGTGVVQVTATASSRRSP